MPDSDAVGVLDSGVGGLSILDKIHRLLPGESLVYVADSAHAPYGHRSSGYIQQRCLEIMAFFEARRVKAVVLACNTATAAAVTMLRARYSLPIIGMEPAVKPAAERSRRGVVGVLATAGTIASDKFVTLSSRFSDVEIITMPCPGLVEEIEKPEPDTAVLDALLGQYVHALVDRGADVLVLGCTHYSLVAGRIARLAGPGVAVMDTGDAVARELRRRLAAAGLAGEAADGGTVAFFSSGDPMRQAPVLSRYWGRPLEVTSLAAQKQPV